ncbi:MAG: type II secretion system minor pseudopilin GspI [Steroidobacteraceae bacterium]
MNRMRAQRGFTLLEVLVALVIVAFGMGALMATLTSAADAVGHLRDKSFAEWIALNRISELRLGLTAPSVGESTGTTEYAGQRWTWSQNVTRLDIAAVIRIDVSVKRAETAGDDAPMLATATGFIGGSLDRARKGGVAPVDWSGAAWEVQAAQDKAASNPQPGANPSNPGTNSPAVPPPVNQPASRE